MKTINLLPVLPLETDTDRAVNEIEYVKSMLKNRFLYDAVKFNILYYTPDFTKYNNIDHDTMKMITTSKFLENAAIADAIYFGAEWRTDCECLSLLYQLKNFDRIIIYSPTSSINGREYIGFIFSQITNKINSDNIEHRNVFHLYDIYCGNSMEELFTDFCVKNNFDKKSSIIQEIFTKNDDGSYSMFGNKIYFVPLKTLIDDGVQLKDHDLIDMSQAKGNPFSEED